MDDSISVAELADEFGHTDGARAIHAFLRNPDDGHGPIGGHLFRPLRHLSAEQAERVRQRFT